MINVRLFARHGRFDIFLIFFFHKANGVLDRKQHAYIFFFLLIIDLKTLHAASKLVSYLELM